MKKTCRFLCTCDFCTCFVRQHNAIVVEVGHMHRSECSCVLRDILVLGWGKLKQLTVTRPWVILYISTRGASQRLCWRERHSSSVRFSCCLRKQHDYSNHNRCSNRKSNQLTTTRPPHLRNYHYYNAGAEPFSADWKPILLCTSCCRHFPDYQMSLIAHDQMK